jgi:hypothetical protein
VLHTSKTRSRSFCFTSNCLRLLWQMSSHNSAVASRTDLIPVWRVSQSPYIATFVGRLCCTRSLIHYNASSMDPYTIVSIEPGGAVSQSPIIFASRIFGFTFPCGCISELTAWTLYLPMKICCVCLVDGYGCPSHIYNIREFDRRHS